jgi:hypothetical protein
MSFLDDIIGLGKTAYSFLKKDSIGSTLAKTALTGFALSQMTKSVNKQNQQPEDKRGTIVTVDPNTDYSIPVVYGKAKLQGTVTDARLSTDRTTMYYVITLCEKTGSLLSSSQPSVIKFAEIYYNKQRVQFQSNGYTIDKLVADDGFEDLSVKGRIKIYCFNDGSAHPVAPVGYTNSGLQAAWQVMQDWTVNHTMNNLVFAVVQITYDSKNNVTGLGDIEFVLENSLTLPGDVLFDYMTNTRYGAGIPAEEIYSS